jgi:Glycosyltransferases involved in cell wall biogenesis
MSGMSRSETPAAVQETAAASWSAIRRIAQRIRGATVDDFIPPWRASVLDDIVLNRPLNVLFRLLRLKALLMERSKIPGLALRKGVTIAIVNWESVDLLHDVLRSIERFGPPSEGRLEVVVVDNGSTDDSRAYLRARRAEGRLRCVLLSRNLYHGPAMDLAFLLSRTEFVVALDVDAFPIADDWLDTLLAPLRAGKFVSGAEARRGYIHPCCLAMRTAYFARRRHTFTPHVGTWDPEHLGRDQWDTGESITRREGLARTTAFPRTRVRGPLQLGSIFGNFVYHNGASTRMRSDVRIDGLTSTDVESAWREAVAEFLGPQPTHPNDTTMTA